MSQVPQQDKKKITLARVKRTEAYAEQVRVQFATTVNEILALYKTMPELDEGEMYSFDGENLKKQKEVERLLRQLHAAATVAIERGIKLEWAAANADCDKLFTSCFGKAVLSTPQFTADAARNNAAMQAFLARSDRGLNLSQRVWKSVEQLRDEMEVSMTVAIGEGESASSMSRKVRKYLNDPDLCFRRFRYKAGEEKIFDDEGNEIGTKPIYGKKWKKRVRKADGSVGWIDYDKDSYKDEWTGRGYYKSSAQNAMRVARTETNIAYRRADNERWQQLDFVLGQRIELSKQHPKKDICDKLAGDYPKDFIFDGWHPQCFCFVTPILMDESEMKKATEAFARGETYTPRGKVIRDYPEGFKSWVRDNAENIAAARERGTEPYFIRNNAQKIDEIIDPSKKKLTALERAAIRHENRTQEQEEAIKLRWQEREQRLAEQKRIERINSTANRVLSVVSGERFAGLDIDTSLLEAAINSGDTDIINTETRALAQLLSKKQQLINKTASNVTKVAAEYNEVDASALQAALASKSLAEIQTQTKLLAQQVSKMKQAEAAISDLIPNAHALHQDYTLTALQTAHKELNAVMQKWLSKYGYSSLEEAPLQHLKNKLDFELSSPTVSYTQNEIVKKAIIEQIRIVEQKIVWNDLITKAESLRTFQTRSAIYKNSLTQIDAAIQSNDVNALQKAIADAEAQQQKLIAKKIKYGGDTKSALNSEYKGSVNGSDISSKVDVRTMTSDDPYRKDCFTNNIARMQGFDAPAKLVTAQEFDTLEKACGEVFYRTVNSTTFRGKNMSSKEFASQLYVAERLELNGPGGRVYGDGMYVATSSWNGTSLKPLSTSNKQTAYSDSRCYGDRNATISEMTFTRPPRLIKQIELESKWNKLTREQQSAFGYNQNTFGCALGYDAMLCRGVNYMVIWNRSIIAVKKQ
jgi:hypothetical protein